MTSIEEHFALLLAGDRPDGSQLLTRPLDVIFQEGAVLAAVDYAGEEHVLIPVGDASVPADRSSRGVALGERTLDTASGQVRYADLHCRVPRLAGPFERLTADLVARLEARPQVPVTTVLETLEDWRALLRAATHGLSREGLLGLVGELEVLGRMASKHPIEAVESWKGPLGERHDFSRSGRAIEVKTSATVSASSVRISSLDQLDPTLADELHLAVVHVNQSVRGPDLEARIDALVDQGIPESRLNDLLHNAGYVRGMDVGLPTAFEVRSIRLWRVAQGFPALGSADIRAAALKCVENIQYDLMLAGLPEPLGNRASERLLTDWGDTR